MRRPLPSRRPRPRLLAVAVALAAAVAPASAASAAGGADAARDAGVAAGTVVRTVTGTLEQVVVDHADGEHGKHDAHDGAGSLVLDSMVVVDGVLRDVPESALAGSGELRSGDAVHVTVQAPQGLDGAQALAATAPDDTDPAARVLAVTAAPGAAAPRASTATTTVAEHTLTVLPVHWGSPDSATRTSLTGVANSVSAYWSEQSGGDVALKPTVRDWLRIPDPGRCDTATIMQSALAAHGAGRATATAHVAVYFPARADCGGWAGMGSIRGGNIWINGVPTVDVLAHEIGHNLGLGHANTATCTSAGVRVSLSADCVQSPYADLADVMGFGTNLPSGNLNSALADHLGFAQVVEVTSLPATVRIARLSEVGAVRAVKIPTAHGLVYVDFRPAQGRDTRRSAWAGIQVHRVVGTGYPETELLDMRPATRSAFATPSLPVGGSWDIPGTGQTLTVTEVGTASATLSLHSTVGVPDTSDAPASDLTFVPVDPTRVLDTRDSATPLAAGERRDVVVAGTHGIPAGARAVALNLTAVGATSPTHLRAWPAGGAIPESSVLNTDPSRVVASGVMLGTSAGGAITVFNASGRVDVIADVTGYYVADGGSGFEALATARRVLDTRTAGPAQGTVTDGRTRTIAVAGSHGIPTDATAVVVNVTSVGAGGNGYLVAHPAGTARPTASTVNHLPHGNATNRATVRLSGGALTVSLSGGAAHVVVDVVGWFGPSGTGRFTPVAPVRAWDTRTTGDPLRTGESRMIVPGTVQPPAGARTAVLNLTATQAASPTYLTAWGGPSGRPATSDLNVRAGADTSNLVLVPWSSGGGVQLYNDAGSVHVVGDVLGWFS